MKKLILVSVAAMALVACGPKNVSFETLEQARAQARSNGEFNAQKFRAEHPEYTNYSLDVQGDSTQKPECPQGDGWASIRLVSKETFVKVGVKCSTVSSSIGCLLDSDFKTKPYAPDDGKCQVVDKVPFPLPKLDK